MCHCNRREGKRRIENMVSRFPITPPHMLSKVTKSIRKIFSFTLILTWLTWFKQQECRSHVKLFHGLAESSSSISSSSIRNYYCHCHYLKYLSNHFSYLSNILIFLIFFEKIYVAKKISKCLSHVLFTFRRTISHDIVSWGVKRFGETGYGCFVDMDFRLKN